MKLFNLGSAREMNPLCVCHIEPHPIDQSVTVLHMSNGHKLEADMKIEDVTKLINEALD